VNWAEAIGILKQQGQAYVLLTVLETKGSIPRDSGSKMLVTDDKLYDTIGGGALEHEAIKVARSLLKQNQKTRQHTQTFNLAKDLKQCCGGVVKLFFETFPANNFSINIFGAGHIGKALVTLLQGLDCQVNWFDSRPEQFPSQLKTMIKTIHLKQVNTMIESCPKNSYYLVMTHDHAVDQELCEAILSRQDSAYCGLVGSSTKGLKFRQRLLKKGYSKKELQKLSCPAGMEKLKSKIPMEIALSITAKLLELRDKNKQSRHNLDTVTPIREPINDRN
jgi:xanthine dehydrogenase accessory factor